MKFLSVRNELIAIIEDQAAEINKLEPDQEFILEVPSIYTFGDTLIIASSFADENQITAHVMGTVMIMQNLIGHSLRNGLLFRGAFSIGSYIEDEASNTVMGEAVADAASWYEKADWMGIVSTPKTNNIIEYRYAPKLLNEAGLWKYPVPLKGGNTLELYSVSWPSRIISDAKSTTISASKYLMACISQLQVPVGTESKFSNTIDYFNAVEKALDLSSGEPGHSR